MVEVPCGDCHLCCRMMTPILPHMGDNPYDYDTATCYTPGKKPFMILNRKLNGDCIYLDDNGCSIHDRAPWVCRDFDCRAAFKNSDRAGRKLAIKNGVMPKAIFDRGKELLDVDRVRPRTGSRGHQV